MSWKQIAAFLGQPVNVAQRWAKSGMPVFRSGRYTAASVDALSKWLGKENGLAEPVHIATGEEDLSAYLRKGIAQVRRRHRQDSASRRAA